MRQVERLTNILDKKQINSFDAYDLTEKDIEFIKEINNEVLSIIPQKAFNCAQLSALLGAVINDNSKIPVVVVSGHLDYLDKRIFNCKTPLPYSSDKKEVNEIWDGHCWVEVPNLVIDISLFRTIYYGNVPENLKEKIVAQFGKGRGSIMASSSQMETIGLKYTPCYKVNETLINGLIKSI